MVTIHDACPVFSTNIFKFADNLDKLRIKYNISLVPSFNERQDLPRFPKFIGKIKSYKGFEIALHGLYHENRKHQLDDFDSRSKAVAEEEEEEICAGL
jgi:predicted deacetylase